MFERAFPLQGRAATRATRRAFEIAVDRDSEGSDPATLLIALAMIDRYARFNEVIRTLASMNPL